MRAIATGAERVGVHEAGAEEWLMPTRPTVERRHSVRTLQPVTLVAGLRLSSFGAQKAFDERMNAAAFQERD